MKESVLTLNTLELKKITGTRTFMALPKEEIDRLYASVEVQKMEHAVADKDFSLTQLVAIVALHYNYSWLAFTIDSTGKANHGSSLCTECHIPPFGNNNIFLDESLNIAACQLIDDWFIVEAGYDIRLAGLICDDSTKFGKSHLGLVFIARLRQAGVICRDDKNVNIKFHGMGELVQNREQFDSTSRVLIDHLIAF